MDTTANNDYTNDYFSSQSNIRKNYASEKIAQNNDVQLQSNIASNQKFEKTASIRTKSSEFEQDEKRIKNQTKSFNAIIQYEQNFGQKGNRQLHLLIGVNPNLFDSFYVDIQKIGVIKATEITKVDKTNEYKQLNAKKASLEKTLQSLIELKTRAGQISDFISLHDKILEVESKLQELGVELGNFDAENEFCTIKLSLYEGVTAKNISILYRIKEAFEWTIQYYAIIIFTLLGISLTVLVLLFIVDKLKIIKTMISKLNE
jgi:uncharacterized protein YfcZ (UPF0381/DUF406 family)